MRTDKLQFEFGNPKIYNTLGCSPELTVSLCKWLQDNVNNIEYVKIALYLFNNQKFYDCLKELSEAGIDVDIFSIPLEGYDNDRPIQLQIYDGTTKVGPYTKLDCAKPIYEEIKTAHSTKLHLHIVPHMYLRSSRVKAFSRGKMPYSLHCKSILVKFKNNQYYAGLTSSNLAVRDAQKIELAYILSLETENEVNSATDFFEGLTENSILVEAFDPRVDYTHFHIKKRPTPANSTLMFTAPFYENSATIFEENIIKIVSKARYRIFVCAQHVCAYDYSVNGAYLNPPQNKHIKKEGFLSAVLKKAKESKIPTTFISQTYVDENGNSCGCRKPENTEAFRSFISKMKEIPNCSYYVNPNLHAKFIIVDNIVLVTTCNFTPTQFIFLPNVEINEFENIPGSSYSGIFCEIGSYIALNNKALTDAMLKNVKEIIRPDCGSRKMFPS